jgi:hypothetical protein
MKTNIFSALSKYNSTSPENYLTESFVFLLNSLLERDRSTAVEILNKLCVNSNEFSFGQDEEISITTQETTTEGRPDIKILTPTKLIYVEVKDESPLGFEQTERYNRALVEYSETIKHLILLTRFEIDLEENQKPHRQVLWRELHDWFEQLVFEDPISKYLADSFRSFLKEKHMSIEKVSWEYINGVPALVNLINMIESGIKNAGLKISSRPQSNDYMGRYFAGTDFWCGIWYNSPLKLKLEIGDKNKFDLNKLQNPTNGKITEDGGLYYFTLNLEEIHFFSLNKDDQLKKIADFIGIGYKEANQMLKSVKS